MLPAHATQVSLSGTTIDKWLGGKRDLGEVGSFLRLWSYQTV